MGEARTLLQETRRLRHDQRKYLLRQLDAARAYEKQLKSELKTLDNDKKEDVSDSEMVVVTVVVVVVVVVAVAVAVVMRLLLLLLL